MTQSEASVLKRLKEVIPGFDFPPDLIVRRVGSVTCDCHIPPVLHIPEEELESVVALLTSICSECRFRAESISPIYMGDPDYGPLPFINAYDHVRRVSAIERRHFPFQHKTQPEESRHAS